MKRTALILPIFLATTLPAYSALTVTFADAGTDVLITISGNVDVSGLTASANLNSVAQDVIRGDATQLNLSVAQSFAREHTQSASVIFDTTNLNAGFSPLNVFRQGFTPSFIQGSNLSSVFFNENGTSSSLFVNDAFTTGTPVTVSNILNDQSIASLGMTLNTSSSVSWITPSGATESVTFQVVPEPSAALLSMLGGLGLLRRRR